MEVGLVKGRARLRPATSARAIWSFFSCSPVSRAVPWSAAAVKGAVSLDRGEHRGMLGGGGDQDEACRGRPVAGDVRVRATRGQTDIRGLVTAGRAVRLEHSAGL